MRAMTWLAVVASFAAVTVLVPRSLRADDTQLAAVDDAAKKLGSGSSVLVVFAKDGSDEAKAAQTALADKKLQKPMKDVTATRVDPGDDDSAKKLNLDAAEKNPSLVVLDGYGIFAAKHAEKAISTDAIAHLLKQADDATKKKKKIEKAMDGAVAKGEAAMKQGDVKTACEQFLGVTSYEKQVPCAAVQAAKKHLGELEEKGSAELQQARTALGKNDLATARKLLAEVLANYPIPSVQDDAKTLRGEIAQEEGNQSK